MGGADVRDRRRDPVRRRDPRRRGRRPHHRGDAPPRPGRHRRARRGPDRARPPPADDHRPVRARRASRWSTPSWGWPRCSTAASTTTSELRAELEGAGYRFFSTSDTEVILKAYHRWGAACVEHFFGMFAFAVAERDTGVLILGRDRLGIKPLYLAETPEPLRFASTLPALLAGGGVDTSIDRVALHHYMTFHSVVPAPRTILAGVRKLPPATVRMIEPDGTGDGARLLAARARAPRRSTRGMTARDWQRRAAGVAADRGAPPHGRRRARSGCCSPAASTPVAGRGAARRGRASTGCKTFSIGFDAGGGRDRRRVRVLRPDRRALRHRPPPDPRSTPTGCCPPSTPPSPR